MPNARPSRRTLLALSACLAVGAALAFALSRRPAPVGEAQTAPAPAPQAEVSTPPPTAAEPVAQPPPDRSGIPHTRLPLRLLATVVRENRALSLATIEDLERTSHEVMSEGQAFEGYPKARIAGIERARILIDNDGVREQLVIVPGASPEVAEITPEQREYRRDLARRLRALTDAGTNYRDVLGPGERGGLLAEGDVSAVYEDGEIVGVQFDEIREGGFYDQIGLRNGDVVTEINGVPLGDPAAAAKVLGEFVSSDELSIAVERGGDGSQETLVVSTPPLRTVVEGFGPPDSE